MTGRAQRSRIAELFLGWALLCAYLACASNEVGGPAEPRGARETMTIQERIDDLVSRMSFSQKVLQLMDTAPAIPELGIPQYVWWNEALHGVAGAGIATVFPQAIGLAATWDPHLIYEVASVISDEARAKHHDAVRHGVRTRFYGLTFFSPNINIFRDPRWGRGQETYGEDPYLTATMAINFVRGMQGEDPHYRKVDTTLKHFAVHSGPEPLRHRFDADCSDRDLRETYLYAFERTVKEAGPAAVMTAYSSFRGEPCSASSLLLGILRNEWGFKGYVVSDCGAIFDILAGHKVVPTLAQAAALALKSGCDLDCGPEYLALFPAALEGLVSEADIDRALKRLLRTRFELGMFDPEDEVPYARIPIETNDSEPHRQKNLEAARKSIVLLKNNGMLPLNRAALEKIAVLGPSAESVDVLLGNYNGTPSRPVTLLTGIREAAGPGIEVAYDKGTEFVGKGRWFGPTARVLQGADVAIVCAGLSPRLEGEEGTILTHVDGFDRGDRTRIELPGVQKDFIRAVYGTGVPVVLVLTTGSPVAITEEDEYLPAILNCWYPGGEGGRAVAEVLFGEYNPAGRLPVTFYRSTSDLPEFTDYHMSGRTYRYFEGPVLYEFGYGLSYTRFEYSDIRVSKTEIGREDTALRVSVTVTNTGVRDGEEVVQVYARDLYSDKPMPLKKLVGFQRVFVPAGKSVPVAIDIRVPDLGYYDEAHAAFVIEPGAFEIQVGASSEDIRLRAVVTYR
jgi:beta-glucosidase